jgi:hypothetical protein
MTIRHNHLLVCLEFFIPVMGASSCESCQTCYEPFFYLLDAQKDGGVLPSISIEQKKVSPVLQKANTELFYKHVRLILTFNIFQYICHQY